MANIYLLQYNNHFNRIVKAPLEDVTDYTSNYPSESYMGVNFIPNDGVTTNHIFNFTVGTFIPDYCIVEDSSTGEILSRWFITEQVRTRQGQYRISLKRDVLADFYNETRSAISFITKGYVNAENPLIFNSENVQVNQIKKHEARLRDDTYCAWVVGYLAPNFASSDVAIDVQFNQEVIPDIEDFEYADYVGKDIAGLVDTEQSYFVVAGTPIGAGSFDYVKRYFNGTGQRDNLLLNIPFGVLLTTNKNSDQLANLTITLDYSVFNTVLTNHLNNNDYLAILALKDKIYKDGGTYKKVVITPNSDVNKLDFNAYSNTQPNITTAVKTSLTNAGCTVTTAWEGETETVPMRIYYSSFKLTLEEVGSPFTTAKVTFKSTIKRLQDAPYKMFCIPLSPYNDTVRIGETDVTIPKDKVLQIANSIATGLKTAADGFLYDIQLLPYCPIADKFTALTDKNGLEYIGGGAEHYDYDIIKNASGTAIGFMFYCEKSSFTINITRFEGSFHWPKINVNDPIDFKATNETTMYKLTSPNFANFEWVNFFKNYGVDYINVDCTYKPLTPYIKLNINYKGLYGSDFDDQRGLILGGDFSLPVINDQWVNYQIQNKNYANIFERENQNLEYKHRWGMASAITGAAVGTGAGAFMGAQLGSAKAGAGIAGVGGALDIISTAAMHGETMDYRRDMFEFNIQNVQALPQGLVKTSAFNYNSKIWPIIEIYTSTAEEKEIVKNKIIYTGMTLNVIGSIENYLNPNGNTYIQGRIIRININEDSHVVAAINNELNMGVYYE